MFGLFLWTDGLLPHSFSYLFHHCTPLFPTHSHRTQWAQGETSLKLKRESCYCIIIGTAVNLPQAEKEASKDHKTRVLNSAVLDDMWKKQVFSSGRKGGKILKKAHAPSQWCHRILESLRLVKTSRITNAQCPLGTCTSWCTPSPMQQAPFSLTGKPLSASAHSVLSMIRHHCLKSLFSGRWICQSANGLQHSNCLPHWLTQLFRHQDLQLWNF